MQLIQLRENQEFMTLGQVLKSEGIIGTGGQIKWFLSEYVVKVNGEQETRRGRKLRAGDEIFIEGHGDFKIIE
ncbi:S4 domain protein YaaA [Pullulanibacillus pueri]|uniref:S4 domain protein YaaA n=1 Tax=Pullulanibacillus pueri TaxID=1437324 RepID=A0A8J2ZUY9_9BACL|nr:S4 domain protein YaaA [Pullulanibacillus pueri]GGH80278.1 S4 domain protein YaaA [Pullulanibacillus pueri]